MATVNGRTYGPRALFLLVAVILFVLAAFDVHISQFSSEDVERFGLAFFAGAFLV